MEERLAMVVSNLDEVKDKLTQYAQGQTDIEQFYLGHVKAEQAEPLLDGREGEAFLKIIIQDQKLSKLAQLWVSGVEIDWTLLYPHHKPQRITLPTYPFARERYWLPESTTRLPSQARGSQLHPFLESNTSTLQEQRYTTALRGDEFFLADHVVGQQKTFPGVAYLEMAWVAGGMAGERAVQTLKDIVWVQPITVSDTPQRVHISFYPTEASQQVEFEVSTFDDDQQRQVHAQGQLAYQSQATTDAETLDLEAIQKRCPESWDQAKCYRLFQGLGLQYGPGFQSIQTLYRNNTEALSHLVLPASLQSGFNDFVLHPALMDGALQTVIGLMGSGTSGTPLPFALAEVSLIKPLPEKCYAYVTLTPESRDLNVKKFHLWFVDDRGQVLLKLKDFSVRAPRTVETTMYYQSVWEPQISPIQTQAQSISQVLLFERDETRYQALQARLGCEVIWVKPGERYQALGNQVYAINPAQASDYRQLLASLAQQHQFPSHIIHFWSQAPFVCDSTLLANQIDLSLYSVFHLSQALLAQPLKAPIQLLYLYLEPDNAPQPQYAAFSGFAKTIRLENPKFIYKTVALSSLSELVDSVLTEIQATDSFDIRYAHTQRWVKRWKAWEPVQKSVPTTRLKEQGVYLVTGGAGGLGLIFAEYLAKQVKEAKLVLTGRSATLNEQKAAKIQAIKALGAEVLYIQADVSKRDDVESMIAQTKAHFGQINGIIHSAGLIRDALLLNKTQENMAAVLAPKILGSVYLDEATKNDKLDFFVLFSSIVAAMGNIGQSDYAYANSFMDNFAQWREGLRAQQQRFGQTLSINWPLWQEGGMQVDSKKQAWLKQVMGMLPLSTEQGLKAFELGLNLASVQMMVVAGEAEQIKKALNPVIQAPTLAATHNKQPINQSEPDKSPLNQSGPEPSQLQAKTEDYLKNFLSQELKLTSSTIQAHAPFEKYGLDSVMMLSLTRKLENHFGTLSKTLFFEYKNLTELGQYFIKNHREQLIDKISDGVVIPAQTETQTVTVLPELENKNLAGITRPRFLNNSIGTSVSSTQTTEKPEDDIAIIGISGRYPMARDLSAFWENLTAGIDGITEIPKERWDASQYEDANPQWGGFIEGVDQFDPLFFNISPREAEIMEPQERLFLETVWHTLEDAGYSRASLKQKPVGVFVGVMWGQYQLFTAYVSDRVQASPFYASIANRVSYYLDFVGPSIALDTMCSSSLTAIHLACDSIRKGESTLAIAGGVNVSIHPNKYTFLSQNKFLSSDGRCRSFGEGGDGYVPGEGVGAILLKPLHQARIDGDHIYAVIKGSSINHGGKTNGYTVPDPNAQASLISSTLKKAQINPRTISYVEAHGTGTSLGDPIEIRGLTKAYQEETVDTQYCAIGSVKSNIGHLESAAGMAALTKVLLQMKYQQLVPSLHSERLNPNINFETSPFYVQHGLTEWKQPIIKENGKEIRYPRRAGISSFGAGGANAHLIVEEYEPPLREVEYHRQKDYIIVLSAKNEDRLQAYIKKIIDCFNSATVAGEVGTTVNEAELPEPIQPDFLLADLAYTLQIGREPLEERLAIVVDSIESLTEKLMQYAQGQTEIAHFYRGNVKTSKAHSALPIEGATSDALLKMLNKQALIQLAQQWVSGIEINWQSFYPNDKKPQRIALPTYPFERRRCWVQITPQDSLSLQSLPVSSEEQQLNPRIQTSFSTADYLRNTKLVSDKLVPFISLMILSFFQENQLLKTHKKISQKKLKKKLGLITEYEPLFQLFLDILHRNGLIIVAHNKVHLTETTFSEEIQNNLKGLNARLELILRAFPDLQPHLRLFAFCKKHYSSILQGSTSPQTLLLSAEPKKWIEAVYRGEHRLAEPLKAAVSERMTDYLELSPPKKASIRILEMGVGTQAITNTILDTLSANKLIQEIIFYCSEKPPLLRNLRQDMVQQSYPVIRFQHIDEHHIKSETNETFDIIVLKGVLPDETTAFRQAINTIRTVISGEGLLFISQPSEVELNYLPLIFGLLDDSWLFQSTLLNNIDLKQILQEAGFTFEEVAGQWLSVAKPNSQQKTRTEKTQTEKVSLPEKGDVKSQVESDLLNLFSELLGISTAEIKVDTDVRDYGVNSLIFSQVFMNLQNKYGSAITPQDVLIHTTITSLAEFIVTEVILGTDSPVHEGNKHTSVSEETADDNRGKHNEDTLSLNRESTPVVSEQMISSFPNIEALLKRQTFTTSLGHQLEFFTCGQGEPVMFLTALAFTRGIWAFQIAAFQSRYQLIFPHLPGHGKSDTKGQFTFKELADDFVELLNALDIPAIHLVGWCMAGNIGQLLAYRHPNRIKTLTLVGTTPTDARLRGLNAEDLREYSYSPLSTYELEFQNIFQQRADKKSVMAYYLNIVNQHHCKVDTEAVLHYINNLFQFDATDKLKDIQAPTLVIAGKWDIAFPPDQVRLLHQGIRQSKFVEFDSAGHLPFLTQHESFNRILGEFLVANSE